MTWSFRRVLWPVAGVIVLAIVAAMRASFLGDDRIPLSLGAAVTAVALAALASGLTYRLTEDPRLLFMAVGAAGLAANLFLFDLVWAGGKAASRFVDPDLLAGPAVGLLVAWLLFAICTVFAVPWWERRGRPPLNPLVVVAVGLGALAAVDLLLFLAPPSTGTPAMDGANPLEPSWFDISVAWVTLGVLVVASLRLAADGARGASSGWLSAATAVAIGGPASWLLLQLDERSAYDASRALYLAVPAVVGTAVVIASIVSARSTMSVMRRASDRAGQIVEGRAEIASMIAHEVRGPVTTIRGIASTAASHYERLGDDERREFFGLIEQESRRLLAAVDQTSTALKVDAGTLTFSMAPTDLAAAVRAGVEAADVGGHPVHVVAQEGVVVEGDPSRLAELVVQLLTNAAKFSPPEAPITVRAVADDPLATIEIDDRGPGIPPEHREAVFGRFVRWRPAGYEEQPGNGLGLFISRGLAAEHQGEISVEEGPAGGTMLRVRLPLGGT